ncbi:hypothetical protein [Pedobacter helvus]|uniref:Alpha-2-macroglobulin n=1 Tax=Pedobacter helvus TaxID=2563444 RepID=A0ABW9JKZ4_9SPHI|nr:hypothetical protein [Pedobacter ureilyticus]
MIRYTLFALLLNLAIYSHAQENAIATLKFEEAEAAFNSGNYATALNKLDEVDKLAGIMSKSLYLRIVVQDKTFNPAALYQDEAQFSLLASLQKNVSNYLRAMESQGLDDRYRTVYAISGKLDKYPKDKSVWLEQKKKADTEKAVTDRKNKELAAYYLEITPKIEAWEWFDEIKIGGDFKVLKKQYPGFYEQFNDKPKKNDQVKGNVVTRISKNFDVFRIPKNLEINTITTEFGVITSYALRLNKSSALEILDKWKQEFGENAIAEYLQDGNNSNIKIKMYLLDLPGSKYKIYIEEISTASVVAFRGVKSIVSKKGDQDFLKNYRKVK